MNAGDTGPVLSVGSTKWSLRAVLGNTLAVAQRQPGTNQPRSLRPAGWLHGVVLAVLVWGSGWTRIWMVRTPQGQPVVSARVADIRGLTRRIVGHLVMLAAVVVFALDYRVSPWIVGGVAMVIGLRLAVLIGLRIDAAGTDLTGTHLLTDLVAHPDAPSGHAWRLLAHLGDRQSREVVVASCDPQLWSKLYGPWSIKTGERDGRIKLIVGQDEQ